MNAIENRPYNYIQPTVHSEFVNERGEQHFLHRIKYNIWVGDLQARRTICTSQKSETKQERERSEEYEWYI